MSSLDTGRNLPPAILIDSSLSIMNRTGAYYIARDICQEFVPRSAQVRHWRFRSIELEGLIRKIAARLMMLEVEWLRDSDFLQIGDKVADDGFRLFLDPLYVLRSNLTERDIVLCHDVGPLTHGALYDARTVASYRLAYSKIARRKPGIVFVSEWSRNNFTRLFGSDFHFLKSIPLYVRSELSNVPEQAFPGLDAQFFLTVGAFETRKNQIAALRAYQAGGFYHQGIAYVLCGSRGTGHQAIFELAKHIPGVLIAGYVPDCQLRWLYAPAEAFVLPSLLEGFGMPALEAAHMGLLPIVSEDSALVEAVEGVCAAVPPIDPEAIAAAMWKALSRSGIEKTETSRSLREIASRATKQRFLTNWKDLLFQH